MIHFLIITCIMAITINASPSGNNQAPIEQKPTASANAVATYFKPDVHITHQIDQDRALLRRMRTLFFKEQPSHNQIRAVYARAINEYGGQEVMLFTNDSVRISALYFKRTNAPINIIIIPGYFFDATPTKEWGAPFTVLFEEYNVLIIDSRGTGESEGFTGLTAQNSYGAHAYHDIQAAIEFMRKENNAATILIGFCFGAAMILHATLQAQKSKKITADALVLNCTFSTFENIFTKAMTFSGRWIIGPLLLQTGLAHWFFKQRCNGNLFELNPIDLIKHITIPCYFEHFAYDNYATIEEGISVFNAAPCTKMFMRSDLGRHVLIHSKVPFQYKEACKEFLYRNNFLPRPDRLTHFQLS